MKSYLPANLSFVGWCLAVIFIPVCFWFYYVVIYGVISGQYQDKLWSSSQFSDNKEKIDIRVNVPKTISDFVDGKIRVQSWNRSENNIDLNLVINADVYDEKSFPMKTDYCKPVQMVQPFIHVSAVSPSDQREKNIVGNSAVTLNVPAYGSSNVDLWIIMQPELKIQPKSCVVLKFFRILPLPLDGKTPANCFLGNNDMMCLITFDDYPTGMFVVRFDRNATFWHSLSNNFLLPPWSNVILPSLVISIIWFVEQAIGFKRKEEKNTEIVKKIKDIVQ